MRLFVVSAAVMAVVLLAPLSVGVWLPDVYFDSPRTLAQASGPDGSRFEVVQYWNHSDFYSTALKHTRPGGDTETHILDGDDSKSWRAPLVLDSEKRLVSVTLSGGRKHTIPWE